MYARMANKYYSRLFLGSNKRFYSQRIFRLTVFISKVQLFSSSSSSKLALWDKNEIFDILCCFKILLWDFRLISFFESYRIYDQIRIAN